MPQRQSQGKVLAVIAVATCVALLTGGGLLWRAAHHTNRTALSEAPQPVSVVESQATTFRQVRSYVGAVQPWVEARIGPQFISAFVKEVLVRPGTFVAKGQVVATLDCSNASAANRAAEMQSRAVTARSRAMTDESARMMEMVDGGFASINEVEQTEARSADEQAQLLEAHAHLQAAALQVQDCYLRAPFDGEIASRLIDPGAFVRPGTEIVSVVDRRIVRVVADAPEMDFEALAAGTLVRIHLLATGARLAAPISRRSPQADALTRTIHFEVDLPDPERRYPVGTTAVVEVDVGQAIPATEVPLYAATEQEGKAKLYVVDGGRAELVKVSVVGESGGSLFLDPLELSGNQLVVTQGRALLSNGEAVTAQVEAPLPTDGGVGAARGGGSGRPL